MSNSNLGADIPNSPSIIKCMSGNLDALLGVGLLFPALSLATGLRSLYCQLRRKHYESAIFIPLIGPVLLDAYLFLKGEPSWTLVVPWIIDVSTIAFAVAAPRLIREWWRTSRFTRQSQFFGEFKNQAVALSLHKTGHYFLHRRWKLTPNETGIVSSGEIGQFTQDKDGIRLQSVNGWRRILRTDSSDSYSIAEETEVPELLSLLKCSFRKH